ncbi:RelA/SpoT domain-containing protein [Campylobacter jejuni]|uniref:RelA/SpoT domain-containing protein n=1 Tax=Campylobacter jejuni TaxID=197 RepID=UPI0011215937|nr:RelA/SpoT domain-containing protein [Campylobacter jejuni]HEE9536911.1 RelA/SpoT domain-containing protein [Campylobacter jejuni subsp. jejuni]EAL0594968.1 (p)ppGpp synthetase [Campylobacter jejuni]EAL7085314.1 (p)ppGpp synthetase [Campylobacter jejuni]ECL3826910.1 (p)ppGpp synthetase [Campylobacter jejuni]ECL4777862.1 (p)ppGpp synthetase [Campylobacter jejuni]
MGDTEVTKQQVRKAGENIRNNIATLKDYEIISNWRSIHISIMTSMVNSINKKLKKHKLKALIVARRLKRLNSIEIKLKRFSSMNLDRMQDIAGVRIVFKTMEQVNEFKTIMDDTYLKGSIKFKLEKTSNYIEQPKSDGYRSIHQIFEYKDGSKKCLELQIRTQLQHNWATAVEVLGMKTKSKIKQGEGEEYYKEFFKLCSALFSTIEETNILEEYSKLTKIEICKKIQKLDSEFNILQTLSGLAISGKNIENQTDKKKNYYYFIIELNIIENTLRINGFKKKDFQRAQWLYGLLEQKSKEKGDTDVVLISLDEFKLLKKAYPNYYLDSGMFISSIKKEINEIKEN